MIYKIKDADGNVYEFKDVEEILSAFCTVLSDSHSYWDGHEWIEA